jgi:hypothetical protein
MPCRKRKSKVSINCLHGRVDITICHDLYWHWNLTEMRDRSVMERSPLVKVVALSTRRTVPMISTVITAEKAP